MSYRKTRRGAQGVIDIKVSDRNGDVVMAVKVSDEDEIIVTSVKGMVIRVPVTTIPHKGRNTQGVRIMRLKEGDKVTAVARLVPPSEEERVVESGTTHTSCPPENGQAEDGPGDDEEPADEDGGGSDE